MITKRSLCKRIEVLEEKIREYGFFRTEYTVCETCGCALKKVRAVRGKSEVREKRIWDGTTQEYVHQVWYCGRCVPTGEKQDTREQYKHVMGLIEGMQVRFRALEDRVTRVEK